MDGNLKRAQRCRRLSCLRAASRSDRAAQRQPVHHDERRRQGGHDVARHWWLHAHVRVAHRAQPRRNPSDLAARVRRNCHQSHRIRRHPSPAAVVRRHNAGLRLGQLGARPRRLGGEGSRNAARHAHAQGAARVQAVGAKHAGGADLRRGQPNFRRCLSWLVDAHRVLREAARRQVALARAQQAFSRLSRRRAQCLPTVHDRHRGQPRQEAQQHGCRRRPDQPTAALAFAACGERATSGRRLLRLHAAAVAAGIERPSRLSCTSRTTGPSAARSLHGFYSATPLVRAGPLTRGGNDGRARTRRTAGRASPWPWRQSGCWRLKSRPVTSRTRFRALVHAAPASRRARLPEPRSQTQVLGRRARRSAGSADLRRIAIAPPQAPGGRLAVGLATV